MKSKAVRILAITVLVVMAMATVAVAWDSSVDTIRVIRKYATDWTGENPILGINDVGFEIDTAKFKFGDGNTAWTGLSYSTPGATGSTAITTLGTIVTGVWHGTAIADGYISSAATWNAKMANTAAAVATAYTGSSSLVTGGAMTVTSLQTANTITAQRAVILSGVTTTCSTTVTSIAIASGIVTSVTCAP